MTVTELILPRLSAVRSCGENRWRAKCPAHDDRTPSLMIRQLADRALVHCFAGCLIGDICEAIGLTVADLFVGSQYTLPNPVALRQRLAAKGLEVWRQAELQRCAEELRARDTLRGVITRMVQAGEMTEDVTWIQLEDVYSGYSLLEYKFQRLLHGEDVLALWRESAAR